MSILAKSNPPITEQLLKEIEAAFPRLNPEPNVTTIEELMFNAGARHVVEWIKHKVNP